MGGRGAASMTAAAAVIAPPIKRFRFIPTPCDHMASRYQGIARAAVGAASRSGSARQDLPQRRGRAVVPDLPELSDIDYMTNVGILELETLPEHLVIIGGSYIALEFARCIGPSARASP